MTSSRTVANPEIPDRTGTSVSPFGVVDAGEALTWCGTALFARVFRCDVDVLRYSLAVFGFEGFAVAVRNEGACGCTECPCSVRHVGCFGE
jgi:hypothetical protein